MQIFFSILVVIWLCIFGFMFFLIFPNDPTFDLPEQKPDTKVTVQEPILMEPEDSSPPITIQETTESPREEYSALEKRLIQIIVKMNSSACKKCNREDKKIILQIKMMQALLDGKPKLALKYSQELTSLLD